jgi:hypothetical protein
MAKLIIKATPEQQAWIAEHAGKRWAAVTIKEDDEIAVLISLHTSYRAACDAAFTGDTFAVKGSDFFDTYDFWVEPLIAEACEVELQPTAVVGPVVHPSLDWIANKVWGWDYKDCHADIRKLVDLAKVNEHGNIDLSYQDLSHAQLSDINLKDADLSHATLILANLNCAKLQGANLFGALISYTTLSNANLSFANLKEVCLRRNFLSCTTKLCGATLAHGVTLSDRYHFIHNIGSDNGVLELYKCESGWYVRRGCFSGSLPEFLAAVEKKHGDNEHGKRYRAIVAVLCD